MTKYFFEPLYWSVFAAALVSTLMLTPMVMRLARRVGAVDYGGYRKVYEGAMPLLGGLAIAIPVAAFCSLFAIGGAIAYGHQIGWIGKHQLEWFGRHPSLVNTFHAFAVLTLGGCVIVAVGLIDDIRGIRVRYKLLGQIFAASFICSAGYYLNVVAVPFVGPVELNPYVGMAISVVWVVGLINAFNLIDGIDGLAAGTAFIISAGLVVLAALTNARVLFLVSTVLAGSTLAFLFFNFHPARIFMGDTGSMFLGYMLGAVTLIDTFKTQTAVVVLTPALALGFPIFETGISMARRWARGKPIFSGDQHHTHHRLLKKGYTQRQTTLLLYGVTLLCMVAAILSVVITPASSVSWVPITLYLATLGGIAWLAGYIRPTNFTSLSERRQRNGILMAYSRFAVLTLKSKLGRISQAEVFNLCRKEMGLCFLEIWLEDGPTLVCSCGVANKEREENFPFRLIEKIKVKSSDGRDVIVLLQFDHEPGNLEQQDVTHTLAHLFEQVHASKLDLHGGAGSDASRLRVLAMR